MAVEIVIDLGEIQGMVDAANSVGRAMSDTSFLNKAARKLAERSKTTFNTTLDSTAQAAPESLHHVYEWDAVGSPVGRLFQLKIGSGTTSTVPIDVDFLPSRKNVAERPMVGSIIPVIVRRKDGTSFMKRMEVWPRQVQHQFTWKAATLEAGLTVNIEAKNSNMLFWVDEDRRIGHMAQSLRIDYGRQKTVGRFSAAWNLFWRSTVKSLVLTPTIEAAEPHVERDVSKEVLRLGKKGRFVPVAGGKTNVDTFAVTFTNKGRPFSGRFTPRENAQVKNSTKKTILRRL